MRFHKKSYQIDRRFLFNPSNHEIMIMKMLFQKHFRLSNSVLRLELRNTIKWDFMYLRAENARFNHDKKNDDSHFRIMHYG